MRCKRIHLGAGSHSSHADVDHYIPLHFRTGEGYVEKETRRSKRICESLGMSFITPVTHLLSKDFAMLLTLSALVALPVSYLLFDKIILINFAYYQAIGWAELLTGAIAIGLLSFLIVSSHALKAARSNPAKVLKSE